jgi:general secretion pathway protein A
MYAPYFGLKKRPFDLSPDPAFLFLAPQHREALAGLTYGILSRKGFLMLSGPAGSGKTTLLSWLLDKLASHQTETSLVVNPTLTPSEFLEMTMLDFGISNIPDGKARRLYMLQEFLLSLHRSGRNAALIVDEAHKLSHELLEEIRLLGNFDQPSGKLLQIVLSGQSELDEILNGPELWQLKQRIGIRAEIKTLDRPTLEYYIRHRWAVAGGAAPLPFSRETLDRIAQWSQGIPRLVNSLCENALTVALAANTRAVKTTHVDEAANDLRLPIPLSLGAMSASTAGPIPPVAERPLLMKAAADASPHHGVAPSRASMMARLVCKLRLA